MVNLSLYSTKNDKIVVFRLHAQVWLHVNIWWSTDGHYDCFLTKKWFSLGLDYQ